MAIDVSTIAFAIDSTAAVRAKDDLAQLAPAMEAVEKGTDSVAASSARMGTSFTAAATSAVRSRVEMSDSAQKYIAALQKELDTLGASRAAIEKIEAETMKFTRAETIATAALGASIEAKQASISASQKQIAAEDAYLKKLKEKVALQGLDAVQAG